MNTLRNKKILVVDDEELIREILVEELAGIGAQVESAENGRIALDMLEKQAFDLVISDFQMSGCNGLELARTMHRKRETRPVFIICTGYARNFNEMECQNSGIDLVVEKPFNVDYVVRVVGDFLKSGLRTP